MSVVQKGIDHTFLLQRRLSLEAEVRAWCSAAVRSACSRQPSCACAACATVVVGRETRVGPARADRDAARRRILSRSTSRRCSICRRQLGYPDIVIEATGSARVVFDAMEILGPNGVLCLLSRDRRRRRERGADRSDQPADRARQPGRVRQRERQPAALRQGVKDFVTIEKKWPGTLSRLLTNRIPWEDHKTVVHRARNRDQVDARDQRVAQEAT